MGILNIYLGGSGKYIAEECKGTGEYYGIKMPEFVAFDLDTRPSHTGAYMLGDKLNTVPPNFGAEAKNSFGKQWANLNLGHALEPADGAAGPRLRPEAAIMRRTGRDTLELPAPADGLWGVRGSGLLAFAALLDPLMRRSSQTDAFLSNLLRGLREEGENNAPIAIHIYASTAGGTGAGMVLPLSLWLRRFALDNNFRANNITIRLFLCNSSTFDNEQAGSPEAQRQMITKGRSGTFAIMRELQLLEKIETEPTTFSRRWLPVKPDPIEYQLGSDVISGVYWIGRRDKDNEASKTDVYDEASLVARAVSNDQVAAGVSAMATQHKHKLAFSAASIEYPKRQIAQQMSGSVARRVFGELIEDPTAVPPRRRISEFGGPAPEDLAAFIHAEEETGVLARGVGDGRADRESMDTLVTSLSKPDETLDAVERGDADTKAIYTAPEENRGTWDDYCTRLFLRLDDVDRAAPGVAENRVRVDLAKHGPRFARWLNEKVVGEALNPPQQHEKPSAIATVRGSVEAIRTVVERIGAYFDPDASVTERVPDPGMQPGMEDWRYRPIADLKREIEEQKNSVLRPPPAERKTLGLGRLIGALLGGIVVAVGVWALLGLVISGVLQVVLAFVVGLLVFLVLTRLLRPTETLAERRVRQEDELFDLYRELLYAYTAAALFKLTRSVFVQEAQGQIRQTLQQLDNLQAVYKKLQDRVDERLAQGIPKPLHAVAQLRPQDDDQLEPSDHQSLTKAREIAPRVRARALVGSGGSLGDIEVQIIPDRTRRPDDLPATGQVSSLVEAVRRQTVGSDQTGYQAGQQELEGLDAAMDREATESLGTQLPSDFPSAAAAWLGMGAAAAPAIAGYLSALVHCTPAGNPQGTGVDRTSSSVELGRSNGGPVYRRLLVGDAAIIPLINEATPRVRGVAQERLSAFIRETAAETGTPALHCPQVGPAIVALTVWYLGEDLFATPEAERALEAFYGVSPRRGEPGVICQYHRNFHVLPEALAATEIEIREARVKPLHPLVVSRLTGSHREEEGPTLIELFYLTRSYRALDYRVAGAGLGDRGTLSLAPPAGAANGREGELRLFSTSPGHKGALTDPFGPSGRPIIDQFDAFVDFMLFDGAQVTEVNGAGTLLATMPGVDLYDHEWRVAGTTAISSAQRSVIELWFNYREPDRVENDTSQMLQLLEADLREMGTSPAGVDWGRAARSVIEAGQEKRRSAGAAVARSAGG